MWRIDCGRPALFEFRGPDAERYLNGQITQDVRRVTGNRLTLPACVTDAKGRLQFRVWISGVADGAFWVEGPADRAEDLEARLSRYLIADDAEIAELTGEWSLIHFTGNPGKAPDGVLARESVRFGVPGMDWWIPEGLEVSLPAEIAELAGDDLETWRIAHGVPMWGCELAEGLLPPEAGLDATDISYQKGCYIGQEVISRIKFAGKVNKRLVRLVIDADVPVDGLRLVDTAGSEAGEITSLSPRVSGEGRAALAYVKRGVDEVFVTGPDGDRHSVRRI